MNQLIESVDIMEEKEELKQQLEQELQWVQYRQKMLNIIEEKLLQMRQIAEQVKQGNLTARELEELNARVTVTWENSKMEG